MIRSMACRRGTGSAASAAWLALVSVAVVGLGVALLVAASAARAATFTVDSTADAPDASPGDGVCATAGGECTLRAAIEEANALAGSDTIGFAPSVGGTITLGGGELSIASDLTIEGPGAQDLSVSGNGSSRVFRIESGATAQIGGLTITEGNVSGGGVGGGIANLGTLTLTESTLTGNTAAAFGGGIYNVGNLTVDRSTVSGNTANFGGGIYNEGNLTLSESTVSGNAGLNAGGGIYNIRTGNLTVDRSTVSGNTAPGGGGIYNGGTLTVDRSTVSENTANFDGGGIFSATSSDFTTTKATITNSTVSGNSATRRGGGVYNTLGLTEIRHSTITDNTAPQGQGGGVASYGDPSIARTEVFSSIVAGNESTDVDFFGGTTNSFASLGHNLVGDGNATGAFNQPGDRTGVDDPRLGALSDNGGPTPTHALLEDSLAIDAGPSACPPPQTDQRGVRRLQGEECDIGAFELEQEPPNRAPVARDNSYSVKEDQVLRVGAPGVLKNDSDPDSDPLSARKVTTTRHGKLTLRADGSFSYSPDKNYSGTDSFAYRAHDGTTAGNTARVTITVRPVAEEPPEEPPDRPACNDGRDNDGDGRVDLRDPGCKSRQDDSERNPRPPNPQPPDPKPECTIKGTSGRDALQGTDRRDVICGYGGDDAIQGMGGGDLVLGGGGEDAIQGGKGGDTLKGQNGNDTIQGQEGDDKLYGGKGRDTLRGGEGRDTTRQ